MKKNTKNLMLVGGALVAGYFLLQPSGDTGGLGGGGGMPLLPVLPSETTAAEPIGAGVTYVFPEMPAPDWAIDAAEVAPKKMPSSPGVPTTAVGALPATPTADTKKYGGFYLPELKAAPLEFFESDIFAKQTGLMTRKRTSEVVGEMLTQSRKAGYIRASKKVAAEKAVVGRTDRTGGRREYNGAGLTGIGERAYSGARSTALSSVKKSRPPPGSPD